MGYSPWGHKESNRTERLTHTNTHTIYIKSYTQVGTLGLFLLLFVNFLLILLARGWERGSDKVGSETRQKEAVNHRLLISGPNSEAVYGCGHILKSLLDPKF